VWCFSVPRYLLLLKELQKYTPASHPHSGSIESAIAKISKIAQHINEQQRHHENASTLLEFQHQIHNLSDDIQIFQPHRRLIRHGILKLMKQEGTATSAFTAAQVGNNFMIILFNDMIRQLTHTPTTFGGPLSPKGYDDDVPRVLTFAPWCCARPLSLSQCTLLSIMITAVS
jgi:ribosomal protein S15P/S13E